MNMREQFGLDYLIVGCSGPHHACQCIQQKLWRAEKIQAKIEMALANLEKCCSDSSDSIKPIPTAFVLGWVRGVREILKEGSESYNE